MNTTVPTSTATVLNFPTPTAHPTWCDRGACQELEAGYGYHVAPGRSVVDQEAAIFWGTEIRAAFLPGFTGGPEVRVHVIDLEEPGAHVNQSVVPFAGSREELRLDAAIAELELLLAETEQS